MEKRNWGQGYCRVQVRYLVINPIILMIIIILYLWKPEWDCWKCLTVPSVSYARYLQAPVPLHVLIDKNTCSCTNLPIISISVYLCRRRRGTNFWNRVSTFVFVGRSHAFYIHCFVFSKNYEIHLDNCTKSIQILTHSHPQGLCWRADGGWWSAIQVTPSITNVNQINSNDTNTSQPIPTPISMPTQKP